jgi:hypothetical protein
MNYLHITLTFLLSVFLIQHSIAQEHDVYQGKLDGAPFKVVVPDNWTDGRVFFHVHGWRPEEAPHEADLNLDDPFYQHILEDGWAIGRTAYLENGVDHDAHTQDLFNLKEWIETEAGQVELLILEGESTAGTLVLRIAERNPELADGVIAKGAFVDLEDETADSFLNGNPSIPSILMSNLTELDGPVSYAAVAATAPVPPSLRPLLRPGHVNVNWLERLDALKAITSWIEDGDSSPITEGTRNVPERETGTIIKEHSLENRVTGINPFFGNVFLGFHPDELHDLGIKQGDSFILHTSGEYRRVYYGESYGDVPLGDWVAFPTAGNTILLARNHESAAETAELKTGDEVVIYRLQN